MTRLVAVQPTLPEHRYPQEQITEVLAEVCLGAGARRELMFRLHRGTRVEYRHLAYPLDFYRGITDFEQANDAFIAAAVELGAAAVQRALDRAGLLATDVDLIMSTTVTGVAVPSLEARIATKIGLRADVKRIPMLGLGCMAGAAGLARTHDYLLGHPDEVAVLLSVELCSLTLQRTDPSTATLIANGLFGDGAAAVVAVGDRRLPPAGRSWRSPQVIDSASLLIPHTERALGWDVGHRGFTIVLGAEVPALVRAELPTAMTEFLAGHGLTVADIDTWIVHPGGPKVLDVVQDCLGLPDDALAMSRRSLAAVGNLSSSSVLHILEDTLAVRPAGDGSLAVLMAMGPGFAMELVLLRW